MSHTTDLPESIDKKTFLNEVFPPDQIAEDETVLISWPDKFTNSAGRVVNYHKQLPWSTRARRRWPEDIGWLYCVSTVARKHKIQRRKEDVRQAFVLPCDDVGTKAMEPPITPNYILETSPDNFQYGYLLNPYDVSTGEGAAYYDACLVGLAQAGYNDFGCRSATRVIKIPGAVHASGFKSRLIFWDPSMRWHLPDLMAAMDVEPAPEVARQTRRRKAGKYEKLEDVYDPVYDWLCAHDHVQDTREDWVRITCPWADLHSEGTDHDAGYSPLDFGKEGRGFHCFHSHGKDHGLQQFLAWVIKQGGPSYNPSYNRIKEALECS